MSVIFLKNAYQLLLWRVQYFPLGYSLSPYEEDHLVAASLAWCAE